MQKKVAWLAFDLYINGKPVKASPKVILKSQINEFNKTEKLDKSKPVSDWERKNTLDC